MKRAILAFSANLLAWGIYPVFTGFGSSGFSSREQRDFYLTTPLCFLAISGLAFVAFNYGRSRKTRTGDLIKLASATLLVVSFLCAIVFLFVSGGGM